MKNIKVDKLSRRNLTKLASRLMKTYQINERFCPNITNQKYFKNIRYLVHRRYIENSIAYDPWQELIADGLLHADYLIEPFLDMLADHNDVREICKWIRKLDYDINSISSNYVSRV